MNHRTKVRLSTAVALFVGLLLLLMPRATGIPFHEWAGLLVVAPLLTHIVIDWRWVVTTTARLFTKIPARARFNYLWDWLFFFLITVALFSGVVISESALPAIGIEMEIDLFWTGIHTLSSRLLLILTGVHIAMHWSWMVGVVRRRAQPTPTATPPAERGSGSSPPRSAFVAVLTILLAAAAITLSILPLASTEWAQALRTNPGVSSTEIGSRPSDLATIATDLTWVLIPMGTAALVTLGVLGISSLVRSRAATRRARASGSARP